MGSSEAETPSKPDKVSSSMQTAVHPYPEWAAMQAYYAPGVGIPPYFSSAMVPGHAPHPYMWSPQPMMPPFGTPYPAIYPHGAGYSHPSVPLGSHAQGQGNITSTTADTAMAITPSTETHVKSSNPKERGLMKKLKGFDGLAVSVSNGNAENAGGAANGQSQSEEAGAEGSSDGSDRSNSQERKRSCSEDSPTKGNEDINAPKISLGVAMAHPNITGKAVAPPPIGMVPGTELRVSTAGKSKTVAVPVPLSSAALVSGRDGVPPEHWVQDERELKRERRKQSNRESARRSRLRKQAETEDLALKVENLASENVALKSEISRLTEMSEKLRQENSALMEKLENPMGGESGETSSKMESQEAPTIGLENLLSRVNNSGEKSEHQENETRESSGGKLHQLLEPSPRTDAVAAG